MPQIQKFAQKRAAGGRDAGARGRHRLLEEAAAEEGAVKTDSGMVYQILKRAPARARRPPTR